MFATMCMFVDSCDVVAASTSRQQAEAADRINQIFNLLGEETFNRLWQEGEDLTLGQADGLALT